MDEKINDNMRTRAQLLQSQIKMTVGLLQIWPNNFPYKTFESTDVYYCCKVNCLAIFEEDLNI